MTHYGYEKHKVETLQPPLISGCPPASGRWWTYGSNTSVITLSENAGKAYYAPLSLPSLSASGIALFPTSTLSATLNIGLYDGANGWPGSKVHEVSFSGSFTANTTKTVDSVLSIDAGYYWLGWSCSSTSLAVRGHSATEGGMTSVSSLASAPVTDDYYGCMSEVVTTNALPNTATPSANRAGANYPRLFSLWFKVV